MSCPYFGSSAIRRDRSPGIDVGQENGSKSAQGELHYSKFLQLDKFLSSQTMISSVHGRIPFHDEHVFIVTHQAFELWFLQILHEIRSILSLMKSDSLDVPMLSRVTDRIQRIVAIIQVCGCQFNVIGTMSAQSFLDFRDNLGNTSGFQSLQFRMIEIYLGVANELRITYSKKQYMDVFDEEERDKLRAALSEPTLLDLVNDWLSKIPHQKAEGFDFWQSFKNSVNAMLDDMKAKAETENDDDIREDLLRRYDGTCQQFQEIFDEEKYNEQFRKHERRLTHKAMQGAIMIFLYSDDRRFRVPFQLTKALMDLDTELTKLRFHHACMVQRMIGGKSGSGGSSGYHYLRSTSSDRYKVFLDLLNMANYLIPRNWIPTLKSDNEHA